MRIVRSSLLFVLLLLCGDSAFACVCRTPDVAEALTRADSVMSGEVIAVTNRRATLRVERVWKGDVGDEVTLVMGGSVLRRTKTTVTVVNQTSCDFNFVTGEKYLIYAENEGAYLRAWKCSRTTKLRHVTEDLEELGEGRPPRRVRRAGLRSNRKPLPALKFKESTSLPVTFLQRKEGLQRRPPGLQFKRVNDVCTRGQLTTIPRRW